MVTNGSPKRAAWGTLSRAQVVQAASRMIRADGYESFTIRGLATDLGVAPMAVYRHVASKDDLVEEVVDRLLGRRWRPRADPSDSSSWLAEAADRFRRFLVSEPAALHIYLSHPVGSPSATARMTAMVQVLARAGVTGDDATHAYAAIHTYTLGFAALEASRRRQSQMAATADGEVSIALAGETSRVTFARGLQLLLAGIWADGSASVS